MKKLFQKDQVWFAVLWIVLYVVGFSNADSLSEAIEIPKLLTVPVGLILAAVLYGFIRKNRLQQYYGLCPFRGSFRSFLYLIPLTVISSVNFWYGVAIQRPLPEILLYILSMCLVGFLEEVIFRGLLFKGMCKSNVTSAIIVSSVTFGMGHIVNLLLGEPLLDTLLQLVYASAMGFCYTAIFHTCGSILPCIVSHAFVNSTSIFAIAPTDRQRILTAVIQTLLSLGYGLWLLRPKGLTGHNNTSTTGCDSFGK